MESLYKETGLSDLLDDNQKLIIPERINHIRIDVGLAGNAPNAAMWLRQTNDRLVIGIEPVELHWEHLRGRINFGDRFLPIKGAIDDVNEPTKQTFYIMESTGASSLLKTTDTHPQKLESEITVNTFSLKFILDHIPWDRFDYIEHIKTDCEGHDFAAVKSLGEYASKVMFITSEVPDGHAHVGEYHFPPFGEHMKFCGFSFTSRPHEVKFTNEKLAAKIGNDFTTLDNTTVGV